MRFIFIGVESMIDNRRWNSGFRVSFSANNFVLFHCFSCFLAICRSWSDISRYSCWHCSLPFRCCQFLAVKMRNPSDFYCLKTVYKSRKARTFYISVLGVVMANATFYPQATLEGKVSRHCAKFLCRSNWEEKKWKDYKWNGFLTFNSFLSLRVLADILFCT